MLFRKKYIIPCFGDTTKCIFEYHMTDIDIEGMPFPKSKRDQRSCPKYGHICPKFMKEFSLSKEDLNIRSTIHCGTLAKQMIQSGQWRLSDMTKEQTEQITALLKRLEDRLIEYPPDKYPNYYDF